MEIIEEGGLGEHHRLPLLTNKEASRLAETVEAGDWAMMLLEKALSGQVDLKSWGSMVGL